MDRAINGTMLEFVCKRCGSDGPTRIDKRNGRPFARCAACINYINSEWNKNNAGKCAAASKRWRVAHPDRVKEQKAIARARHNKANNGAAHVPVISKSERRHGYYLSNRSKIRASARRHYRSNSDRIRATNRKWATLNPESRRASQNARRAKQSRAPVCDLTSAQWKEILDVFNNQCAYCLISMDRPTQDHVIALSRGGSHTYENVAPSCLSCNASKHARPVFEMVNQ